MLRRFQDWLLHRRGMEKLGVPFRALPGDTPYEQWLETARSTFPYRECIHIADVRTAGLEPWDELGPGIAGMYLRLADYQITDGRMLEIPAGGSTDSARHGYEVGVYFLSGQGHTSLFENGSEALRLDWKEGSVIFIPINCEYRHVNHGSVPARLLAVTSFPFVLNVTGNPRGIENSPFRIHDWMSEGKISDFLIEDALRAELHARPRRGKGVRNRYWDLAGNRMLSVSVSEMPGRAVKPAHRGNSDATVVLLSGKGHIVTWPDGAWHKKIQIDFGPGTLFAAPIYWYRQFLSTGHTPARNQTFSASSLVRRQGVRFVDQLESDVPGITRLWKSEQ